jgi:hypothetical protein
VDTAASGGSFQLFHMNFQQVLPLLSRISFHEYDDLVTIRL